MPHVGVSVGSADIWSLYEEQTCRHLTNVTSLHHHAVNKETLSVEAFLFPTETEVRVRGPAGRLMVYEVPDSASNYEVALFNTLMQRLHQVGKLTVTR